MAATKADATDFEQADISRMRKIARPASTNKLGASASCSGTSEKMNPSDPKPDFKSLPPELLAIIFNNLSPIDCFCLGNAFKNASKELLRLYGKVRIWPYCISPGYDRRIIWRYDYNRATWMAELVAQ